MWFLLVGGLWVGCCKLVVVVFCGFGIICVSGGGVSGLGCAPFWVLLVLLYFRVWLVSWGFLIGVGWYNTDYRWVWMDFCLGLRAVGGVLRLV